MVDTVIGVPTLNAVLNVETVSKNANESVTIQYLATVEKVVSD